MTLRYLIECDAVHPERTPPRCRAFLSVPRWSRNPYRYFVRYGWRSTGSESPRKHLCPSCARAAGA